MRRQASTQREESAHRQAMTEEHQWQAGRSAVAVIQAV